LCKLYSNANIPIFARTLGSFLISFKAPFFGYHNIWFHLVSFFKIVLREWWFHVCAPYTSTKIEYFVHTPWGASSYYLEHPFGLIIRSLFNCSFDRLLSSFVEVYPSCYLILFGIFDPQYSFISFKNFPLYMCMCFHSFILDMHTILEELSLY
jgi:hypothetical protein